MDSSHRPWRSKPEFSTPPDTALLQIALLAKPKNRVAGTCLVHKIHSLPGTVPCLPPCRLSSLHLGMDQSSLSGLDLGSAWNTRPILDSALVDQPGTWARCIEKVHVTYSSGKPTVVHPPQAPHLSQWYWFSVFPPSPLHHWASEVE